MQVTSFQGGLKYFHTSFQRGYSTFQNICCFESCCCLPHLVENKEKCGSNNAVEIISSYFTHLCLLNSGFNSELKQHGKNKEARPDFNTLQCWMEKGEWGRKMVDLENKSFCLNVPTRILIPRKERRNLFFFCGPPGRYSGAPDPTLRTAGLIEF